MAEVQQVPEPTREHRLLKKRVGRWKVECTYYMNPAHPPLEVTATETVEMIGEFWARSHFVAEIEGSVLLGSSTVGYEPHRGKWVSTWIDNATPALFLFEGDLDEETGTLEMTGSGPHPVTGETAQYRTVETMLGPDRREFDMFITLATGDEMQMFSYVYSREG